MTPRNHNGGGDMIDRNDKLWFKSAIFYEVPIPTATAMAISRG